MTPRRHRTADAPLLLALRLGVAVLLGSVGAPAADCSAVKQELQNQGVEFAWDLIDQRLVHLMCATLLVSELLDDAGQPQAPLPASPPSLAVLTRARNLIDLAYTHADAFDRVLYAKTLYFRLAYGAGVPDPVEREALRSRQPALAARAQTVRDQLARVLPAAGEGDTPTVVRVIEVRAPETVHPPDARPSVSASPTPSLVSEPPAAAAPGATPAAGTDGMLALLLDPLRQPCPAESPSGTDDLRAWPKVTDLCEGREKLLGLLATSPQSLARSAALAGRVLDELDQLCGLYPITNPAGAPIGLPEDLWLFRTVVACYADTLKLYTDLDARPIRITDRAAAEEDLREASSVLDAHRERVETCRQTTRGLNLGDYESLAAEFQQRRGLLGRLQGPQGQP